MPSSCCLWKKVALNLRSVANIVATLSYATYGFVLRWNVSETIKNNGLAIGYG